MLDLSYPRHLATSTLILSASPLKHEPPPSQYYYVPRLGLLATTTWSLVHGSCTPAFVITQLSRDTMPSTFRRPRGQTYELLPRASHDSDPDTERDGFIHAFHRQPTRTSPSWMPDWLSRIYAYLQPTLNTIISPCGGRRRFSRPLYCIFFGVPYLLIILVVLTAIFRPSYTHPPPHYKELRSRAVATKELGRGNINNEKIFIAASIYDHEGELLGGAWGKAVLDLVDLLGPSNVYLSIYENDADPKAMEALDTFRNLVTCRCYYWPVIFSC